MDSNTTVVSQGPGGGKVPKIIQISNPKDNSLLYLTYEISHFSKGFLAKGVRDF